MKMTMSSKRFTIAMSTSGSMGSLKTPRMNVTVATGLLLIANHLGSLQNAFALRLLRVDSIPHHLQRLVSAHHHLESYLATLLDGCALHHLLA